MKKCCCNCMRATEKNISLENLTEFVEKNSAIIIDVRSIQEFREGHIKNAINFPVYEIRRSFYKYFQNKNQYFVVYCSYGGRSKKAQFILNSLGYVNVYNLKYKNKC